MTFIDDPNFPKITTSKVGFQIIKCLKCGNTAKEPIETLRTPWDVWPKGCPKCHGTKVDVDLIF